MDASAIFEIRRKHCEAFFSPIPYRDVVIISDKSEEVNAAFLVELNSVENHYVVRNDIRKTISSPVWIQSSPGVFMTRSGLATSKKTEYIYKNVVPKFTLEAITLSIYDTV